MSEHAIIAPSSANRIMACTGSRKLAAMFPQPDTIESQEGTAAHWALSELLHNQPIAVGQVASNGIVLNDEMIEGAEMAADYINDRGLTGIVRAGIETTIKNGTLHHHNWGTPDYWAYQEFEIGDKYLYVDDFKFGHEFVDVYENYQLINYVALLLWELQITEMDRQKITVHMTIIQPRNYHKDGPIRTWSVPAVKLLPYFTNMRTRFKESMEDAAPVTVNQHCKHCPARHACEGLQQAGYSSVQQAYESVPLHLSPAATGLELRMLRRAADAMAARITGLEEQVITEIAHGRNVPYFSIQHGQARQVWNKPIEEVIAMARMLDIDISKPDILTPKQAIKKGVMPELVDAYSITPNGAAKLVEDDGSGASRVFTKLS